MSRVQREVREVQDRSRRKDRKNQLEKTERLLVALRNKVNSEKHSEVYWGYREGKGLKSYMYGPMDFAKTRKLRFRVEDLDLPERRKGYILVTGRRRKYMHRCARVAKQ